MDNTKCMTRLQNYSEEFIEGSNNNSMRAVEKPLNLFALFSLVSSLEVYVLDQNYFALCVVGAAPGIHFVIQMILKKSHH